MTADHVKLRRPPKEASEKLQKQIKEGSLLNTRSVAQPDQFHIEARAWLDFNVQLLKDLFTTNEVLKEYMKSEFARSNFDVFADQYEKEIDDLKEEIRDKLPRLNSILKRLEFFPVSLIGHEEASMTKPFSIEHLHKEICLKCQSLYQRGAYAEAVEKGFKVVRDRLRNLTGHETGSDAFGKGKLHIKGAAASHVDKDFNEGVKFLTMAIDRFRNEKSHTSDARIDDPARAYEYLILCSLAMHLLDNAEIHTI